MRRRDLLALAGPALLTHAPLRAAENGVTDNEVVLGHTGILSGPLGEVIKVMLLGATAVFDEVNQRGGVAGRRIKLVSLDDELKPDKAVANYDRLLSEHKAFAFFGCVGSGTTAAAATLLKDSGAPLVGGYAVADSARDKVQGAAYFVRATTGREAQVLLKHLTTLGLTRIGVAPPRQPRRRGGAQPGQEGDGRPAAAACGGGGHQGRRQQRRRGRGHAGRPADPGRDHVPGRHAGRPRS
jgi:branched-chain amino acid transport system substrate-binding protein